MKLLCWLVVIMLSGCSTVHYRFENDKVIYGKRSWNYDPVDWVVDDADPKTFANLGKGYGKDNYSVFYKGGKIEGADPHTFSIIDGSYSKDAKNVFLTMCKLKLANSNSFRILKGLWGTDGIRVYHGFNNIPEAEASSFKSLSDDWAIDSKRAYHKLPVYSGCDDEEKFITLKTFEGVDYQTFKVINSFQAKDRYRHYDALENTAQPGIPH